MSGDFAEQETGNETMIFKARIIKDGRVKRVSFKSQREFKKFFRTTQRTGKYPAWVKNK